MAVIGKRTKQPREVQDYDVDYGDQYLVAGDVLDHADVDIRLLAGPEEDPLTLDRVEMSLEVVKVWLRGGADGARYRVEVRATTVLGRHKEAEFDINVKEV